MPRRVVSIVGLVTLVALAGCGGSEAPKETIPVAPPHGGQLVKLPNDLGLVEVVLRPSGATPGQASRIRATEPGTQITAYFLGPDGSGPIDPSPFDVRLTIETGRGTQVIDLKPAAGSPDVAFVSESIPFGHDLSGELSARIGGQLATATLVVR